ncbi:MAG: hypothetical protein MPN21_17195 [Thermoanaerobaculia bacterium]|nr:hypothetical protein [Thermoanaerobaculia bacterium]
MRDLRGVARTGLGLAALALLLPATVMAGGKSSRLSDEPRPLDLEGVPERPKPILELGEPFLGTGTLRRGFRLPTGAVWQPSALLFGSWRTAAQTFESDAGTGRVTELATRLDLFLNLQLSGSERLMVGVRALDGGGRFTSYFFEHPDPSLEDSFRDEVDADLDVLFFEGDFGEIFPNLDREDFGTLDYGFSIGRQNLLFQEGLLINDTIDGIGVTRNTLLPGNSPNFRATFFYGWGDVDTSAGAEREGNLFALLTSSDIRWSTIDADIAYVTDDDDGDLLAAGVSAVQRLGRTNSSFRLLGSTALDDVSNTATDGFLLFSELSWVPHGTHDLIYANNFWAIDQYSPAARGVGGAAGGPLGRAGISFASVDLGSFDAPLSSRAHDVFGGAVGYQRFLDHTRKQILVELGYRFGTVDSEPDALAGIVRFQSAAGRRFVWVVDAFAGYRELVGGGNQDPYGARVELVVKF